MSEQEERLMLALIPGLMQRVGQPGYTDQSVIWEAYNLAKGFYQKLERIRQVRNLDGSIPF